MDTLSSIPLSCIVACNREIANKSIFNSLAMSSLYDSNNISENITIDSSRDRSNIYSKNPFQSSLAAFISLSISSIKYTTYMEIQSEDFNWANQTDAIIFNIPFFSQVEGRSVNYVPANNNSQSLSTYVDLMSNSYSTTKQADLSPFSFSYAEL